MDLNKFYPENLKNVHPSEFRELSKDDIMQLASQFPHMKADLRIKKVDGQSIEAPATYRSLYSLLRSGHKFYISGTKYGIPKPIAKDLEKVVEDLSKPEFIALSQDIFKPKINKNERRKTTKGVRNK